MKVRNQSIVNIDRYIRDVLVGNAEYRFPILLALSFRIGLSSWVAIIWFIVDQEFGLIYNWSWINGAYSGIYPHESIIGRMMIDAWVHWDASHLLAIAKFGYQNLELGNLNYFPLFPLATRVTGRIVFGDIAFAGLLVTTASAVLAVTLLYRLIIVIWNDYELARWSVLVWLIFPSSFFLFAPYSDALYICLILGCFLMLRKKNWVMSGI